MLSFFKVVEDKGNVKKETEFCCLNYLCLSQPDVMFLLPPTEKVPPLSMGEISLIYFQTVKSWMSDGKYEQIIEWFGLEGTRGSRLVQAQLKQSWLCIIVKCNSEVSWGWMGAFQGKSWVAPRMEISYQSNLLQCVTTLPVRRCFFFFLPLFPLDI